MTFLDQLRNARETAASAYHLFLLDYPKASDEVYVFLEGRDDSSFYNTFLCRFVDDIGMLHLYRCGNKKGVYEAYRKVQNGRARAGVILFFADKDLSDILKEQYPQAPNIYVTDYYSVENYVVSEDMLWRIWEDFYDLGKKRVDFGVVAGKFREELAKFYDIVRPIMVWVVYCWRNGLPPILNNVKMSKVCTLDDDCTVRPVKGLDLTDELEQRCKVDTPEGYASASDEIVSELLALEPKMFVRGKFELWFLIKFLARLTERLKDSVLEGGQRLKIRTSIGESNAMEILGPRTVIPTSLETFLENNLAPKH